VSDSTGSESIRDGYLAALLTGDREGALRLAREAVTCDQLGPQADALVEALREGSEQVKKLASAAG
jgi:hypothetical protein